MSKEDEELYVKATGFCEKNMTPGQLRDKIGVIDDAQWGRVWGLFMFRGGRTKQKGTRVVISQCPKTLSRAADSEDTGKLKWPATEPERFAAVRGALMVHMNNKQSVTAAQIQDEFARVGDKRIKEILDILVALGIAQKISGKYGHA